LSLGTNNNNVDGEDVEDDDENDPSQCAFWKQGECNIYLLTGQYTIEQNRVPKD